MRSEGTVVGSVCLPVSLHLTPRTSVRPRNDTIYPTGDEGQGELARGKTKPSPSISDTAHAFTDACASQCAKGLHFSAFH